MQLIGTKIGEFNLQAYHNAEFKEITNKDLEGKWSAIFFYPANFTFV